jgi:hypothetical protein
MEKVPYSLSHSRPDLLLSQYMNTARDKYDYCMIVSNAIPQSKFHTGADNISGKRLFFEYYATLDDKKKRELH